MFSESRSWYAFRERVRYVEGAWAFEQLDDFVANKVAEEVFLDIDVPTGFVLCGSWRYM
jgi:hypothetical protein